MASLDSYRFPMNFAGTCLRLAEALGLEGERLLAEAGVRRADLANPDAFLTGTQLVRLIRAGERANQTDLPLSVLIAQNISFSNLGLLGVAMVSADDVARALEVGVQYGKWLMPALDVSVSRQGDVFTLAMQVAPELDEVGPVMIESMVLGNKQLDAHFSAPIHLERVRFAHAARYPETLYVQRLGCPVEFGSGVNHVVVDARSLSVASRSADRATLEQVTQQLRSKLNEATEPLRWADRVRELWLTAAGSQEFLSQEELARRLAVSAKTLARKLAAESTGYQEVIRDVRLELALELIQQSALSMSDIAYRVGFENEAAFYRAFKQWTGRTPRSYRRSPG